jgi:transposase InsO family protein
MVKMKGRPSGFCSGRCTCSWSSPGRYGKPRPAEVLSERIYRKNGIKQLLTKPRSPPATGKVERWHQTLQTDFLDDAGPFATIAAAQAAVDAWR